MRSITRHMGRFLSVLLTAAMLVTSVPQSVFTANAAELPGTDSAPPTITDTENADTAGSAEPAVETDHSSAEETAPEGILPEDPAPEDGLTQETPPSDPIPEESAPEKEPTEETEPEGTMPEETPTEDETPAEAEPGKELPEESDPEDTIPADVQEETVSENTLESSLAPDEQEIEPPAGDKQVYASNTGYHNPSVRWTLYTDGELLVKGSGEIVNTEYSGNNDDVPWYAYREDILSATVRVKGATTARNMFEFCENLETVDLTGFDTSEVTDMSCMFRVCRSLKEIDVSTFHTEKVTNMSNMFSNCDSLTKLDLSSFDTSNVTTMGYLVEYCDSLKEINVSSFDTSKVHDMTRMFNECPSLETLDLSNFVINTTEVSEMVNCSQSTGSQLREIQTPKEIDSRVTIRLPKTNGYCSWRTEDGQKVTGFDSSLAGTTLSTDGYAGIRFEGTHFTLAEYPGTDIENVEKVFPTGSKEPFTFTIVPDEGYTVEPSVMPKFSSTKITVTPGDKPYQYIVKPKDLEQGYVHDEVITVSVAAPAINPLEIKYSDYTIADFFVVANGKKLADHMAASLSVGNNYDVTLYVKPEALQESSNAEYQVPILDLYTQDANGSKVKKQIHCEKDAESLTAEEKEFSEGGYFVLRLGRIYNEAYIDLWTVNMYRITVATDGFPENVQVVRYVKYTEINSYGGEEIHYEEQVCSEETFVEDGETFLIRLQWSDPSGAHKWCRLQTLTRWANENDWWAIEPVTHPAISEKIWEINTLYGSRDVRFLLTPHKIELAYPDGDITNLTVNTEGVQFSEDMHTIEVHSADTLSVSFTLDEELTMNGISVEGNGETEGLASLKEEGERKWTITVNDLPSRLYDINKININAEDPKGRLSLSDPNNRVAVEYTENKKKPLVYRNEPIVLDKLIVRIRYTDSNGKGKYRTLESTDYTAVYSNNINAGNKTAAITITANPDSTKCRGQYTYYFTIGKANSFSIPDAHFNVEAELPQTDLNELVIDGTYDKNVKPTKYQFLSCRRGEIFEDDPVINGNIMTYRIRSDANRDSAQATVTLRASFANYQDCDFTCNVQLVKRDSLVLGGSLAGDKVYDGIAFAPNAEGLQVISKEGATPSAEDAAAILGSIKSTLSYRYAGTEGTTYDSETPPVDVGAYKLQAKVSGDNILYKSDWSDVGTFRITQRDVTFTAKDITRYVNDTTPASNEYDYTVEGLLNGDVITKEPVLTCGIQSTEKTAEYPIRVTVADAANKIIVQINNAAGKDVTANYHIIGKEGVLRIEEPKLGSYTVIYSLSGKGTDIRRSGTAAGSLLSRPADPIVDGYKFLGWYLDETLAKTWDFATDTIQGDLTLYAGWSKDVSTNPDDGMQIYVQELLPQTYTGKALKPAITVYAADGRTLLKQNKDYSVNYKNNTDADTKKFGGQNTIPAGGIGSGVSDTSKGFDSHLAYAVITGKGNYTGTVYMNFHINPVDISHVSDTASGITLKYTESFEEKSGKTAAIVTQLKTKTAKLKYGTDYTLAVMKTPGDSKVTLTDKGQLPLNSGTYKLIIEGTGNYTGSIEKELYVADKSQLIKNAKVTCTGTIADVTKEQLAAGVEAQNLQVSMAGTPLTEDTNYTVEYTNNTGIGTATVTVKGKNDYFGSKSITFKIKGTAFKENEFGTVSIQDMTYTGAALTQNDVVLMKGSTPLVYGEDYTISYKNNMNKGKATMTFTAKPSSGYSGSFKKTFKINPLNLDSPEILLHGAQKKDGASRWTLAESVPYQKGGATPSDMLSLQLTATNACLAAGKDYTVKYKDNTDVSEGKAYMTLTGKGNFAGSTTIYFDIRKASLSELYEAGTVSITPKAVKATFSYRPYTEDGEHYEELRDEDYEFKPAITIKHGKKALKKGEDFMVSYSGNVRYKLEGGGGTPEATVTGIGNYAGTLTEEDTPITIPLSIYQKSLSSSTVYVVYDDKNTDYRYTGEPIRPKVTAVYYGKAADVSKAKREGETNEYLLTEEKTPPDRDNPNPDYAYGLTKLQEYEYGKGDYILSYGANTAKGKTGKVIITGVYDYGGTATSTFTIDPKNIYTFVYKDE